MSIAVTDTGTGIAPINSPKFEPFYEGVGKAPAVSQPHGVIGADSGYTVDSTEGQGYLLIAFPADSSERQS